MKSDEQGRRKSRKELSTFYLRFCDPCRDRIFLWAGYPGSLTAGLMSVIPAGIFRFMSRLLGSFPQQGDHDALDDEFLGRYEIGEVFILCMKISFTFLGDETFECGFAIDEGGDDIAVAGFAFFEDDGVTIANMRIDHGFATDAEGESLVFAAAAERGDVDGDAAFGFWGGAFAEAGGDATVDRDVADFFAVEFLRENYGAGFSGNALDDAFFLKRTEVAHGSGLAGETEVVLKLPSARHQTSGAAGFVEIFEDFLLS